MGAGIIKFMLKLVVVSALEAIAVVVISASVPAVAWWCFRHLMLGGIGSASQVIFMREWSILFADDIVRE